MHDHLKVWVRTSALDGGVGVLGELGYFVGRIGAPGDRLVDNFEADYCTGVSSAAIFLCHGDENGDGFSPVVGFLPVDGAPVARIVEAVLASRRPVAVDPDFHASLLSPAYGLLEVEIGAFANA